MSVANATENAAISGEWGAEMVPYVLKSEAWKGREISVLLPKGTQYSRGVITTT